MTNPQHEALVEAVARAICANNVRYVGPKDDRDFEQRVSEEWEGWVQDAEAAIAALSVTAAAPSEEVGRLRLLLFRKGARDMSLAVWHSSRLLQKGEDPKSLEHWHADDWPIARRPVLLSYRVRERTFFILAGVMKPVRNGVIEGTHP